MSFLPKFFAPSAAWLFALLVPIVIFYFLKLRRSRLEISSLALWRQVINDQRVNAPFQKFKRNLLLLLQLLLLCAIALAAMQPYLAGDARDLNFLPVLIDCSASMGAVDQSGRSRLDLVKDEISEIIDGLLPNQQLTLISVGSTARRLTEFTDNKPVLRAALNSLDVQDVPSRIEDGLRLVQALARTQKIERMRFYSDGNLPTWQSPATGLPMAAVDVDLPFQLDFFPVPAAGQNMGITALNARRAGLDRWDLFLRVDGSRTGSSEADLSLTANGQEMGREHVILGPGESQRLVFHVPADVSSDVVASLVPVGQDALASDNRAWLHLPAVREISVRCSDSLRTFVHALQSIDGVAVQTEQDESGRSGEVDLVVSDQAGDESQQAPVVVLVGVVPRDLAGLITVKQESAEVIDWQPDVPLLRHVQLKDVIIAESPQKQAGVEDRQIEQQGYDILAHGSQGPLILRKRDGTRLKYYFLFHLDQSTLPYRVGFPVLVANIVDECIQQAAQGEQTAASTGVLPPLQLTPNGSYRITDPLGRHEERSADDEGILSGIAATHVGEYEVRSGANLVDRIGASLLSVEETSLSGVDRIYFNEVSVAAQEQRLKEDKPLWTQLALLAFGLLLLEWWYFQKRPAGVPD